jgi:pilus assembly protein CpaF
MMKPFGQRDVNRGIPAAPSSPVMVPDAMDHDTSTVIELREQVLRDIDPSEAVTMTTETLERQIELLIHQIANERRLELSAAEQARMAHEFANDMTGFGPLQSLLLDESVNDIMVNGPNKVYVCRAGKFERVAIRFRDNVHIASIGQKIASRVGRRIDEASPMVDARLQDGSRVNIIFPPLALDSPCISIRKFPAKRFDLQALIANGSMNAGIARLLEIAARARLNVLISGGTGSGKTTLLNAMSRAIDLGERIITIEDAAELQLQQSHVIRLETRPLSLEGTGQVTQRDLVWNALRMQPDRIIVGEVRGAEAFDMLQAMNTGHDGSISTIHANSARDALTRVENMVQMGQVNLPPRAIRMQIVSALDMIVQVERMRDGQRRLMQITEICGLEEDVVTTNDVALFKFSHEDAKGGIVGQYASSLAIPKFNERLAYFGLERAWREAMQEAVAQ